MPFRPDKYGDAFVTHDELSSLTGEMTSRFDAMDTQFQKLRSDLHDVRKDVGRLQHGLESVLNVVSSIDTPTR